MSDVLEEKKLDRVERPLVTFALFAYNQEEYIREAVEGALSQIYSPLEIILSDDCSTDRTFEIMRELASGYRGPHKLVLNSNESNFGVGAHVNRIVKMAEGELIIAAAGDDISVPQRTDAMVQLWLNKKKPFVVRCNYTKINDQGVVIEAASSTPDWTYNICLKSSKSYQETLLKYLRWEFTSQGLYGATLCWSKDSFDYYGLFNRDVWYEDRLVFLRAFLSRSIAFADESLVFYRQHDMSLTFTGRKNMENFHDFYLMEDHAVTISKRRIGHLKQHISDIKKAYENNLISDETRDMLYDELNRQIKIAEIRSVWWSTNMTEKIFSLYPKIKVTGELNEVRWFRARLFPIEIFYLITKMKRIAVLKLFRRNKD